MRGTYLEDAIASLNQPLLLYVLTLNLRFTFIYHAYQFDLDAEDLRGKKTLPISVSLIRFKTRSRTLSFSKV